MPSIAVCSCSVSVLCATISGRDLSAYIDSNPITVGG